MSPPDSQTQGADSAFEELRAAAESCTSCGLCEQRTQVVFGSGDPHADLMFIGEGPGAEEDRTGLPFVGRSGKLLDRLMGEEMGLTRDSVYIANVVKCRPPANRDPRPEEIAACRPHLERQLELIDPKVVVTLGNFSSKLLMDTRIGITKLRGRAYAWSGRALVPTLHPAAVLRGGGDAMAMVRADLVRAQMIVNRSTGDPSETEPDVVDLTELSELADVAGANR